VNSTNIYQSIKIKAKYMIGHVIVVLFNQVKCKYWSKISWCNICGHWRCI